MAKTFSLKEKLAKEQAAGTRELNLIEATNRTGTRMVSR